MPPGLPGWEWCACGWKIEELEARMRMSIMAQQAQADGAAERAARAIGTSSLSSRAGSILTGVSGGTPGSEEENKLWADRGRQGSR